MAKFMKRSGDAPNIPESVGGWTGKSIPKCNLRRSWEPALGYFENETSKPTSLPQFLTDSCSSEPCQGLGSEAGNLQELIPDLQKKPRGRLKMAYTTNIWLIEMGKL